MSDLLREQLSALIDGELPGEECELLVKRIGNSAELARSWHAYHLIGDALRDELSSGDAERLAGRVREALSEKAEPPASTHRGLRRWSTLAAGVTVLGLAGLTGALISSHIEPGKVFAPAGSAAGGSAPVHVDWRRAPAPVQAELSQYLLMHDPYGMASSPAAHNAQGAATSPTAGGAVNDETLPTPPL
ncbi:MAG: sigma-E factor negative regulatory protein [Gammaproteobacteria bacterium]